MMLSRLLLRICSNILIDYPLTGIGAKVQGRALYDAIIGENRNFSFSSRQIDNVMRYSHAGDVATQAAHYFQTGTN